MDRLLQENMRWLQAVSQVLHVSVPILVALTERRIPRQPGVRNKCNYAVNDVRCDPPGHLCIYLVESAGKLQEDVVFDQRESSATAFAIIVPGVMEVEGGTMINEPEASVP